MALMLAAAVLSWLAPALAGRTLAIPQEDAAQGPRDTGWKGLRDRFLGNDVHAYEEAVASGADSVPWLVGILQDSSAGNSRFVAANALGEIGTDECVAPLLHALGDPWFSVRRCAALALGRIGDERARQPLARLAEKDPFVWTDPKSREKSYLVRIDAKRALEMFDERKEVFLGDASNPPKPAVEVETRKCPWPFPGGFRKQNLYNNYQQPTDAYIHAGMDLLQEAGTEVRAVDAGRVAVIATNYPDWKTHHFFIVEPVPGSGEGWCYTHVDPDTFTFKVGDSIEPGQVLGKVVDFSVGENDGVDHLHLHYVAFQVHPDGHVDFHSLYDPLQRFEWTDDRKPFLQTPFRFVHNGGLKPFPVIEGMPQVAGQVDILAVIADDAYPEQVANWMTAVVTLEIRGEGVRPWRKLVLDQRGPIEDDRQTALYLGYEESQPFVEDLPRTPAPHVVVVTNTDGDGVIESTDEAFSWDTEQRGDHGERRFPDGEYDVVVRTWDLAGNMAEGKTRVRVKNDG